jgi:hypothetical protein
MSIPFWDSIRYAELAIGASRPVRRRYESAL